MYKLFSLFIIAFVSTTALFAQKTKQLNVIIVFTDDQGYQDLGCYGSPNIKTPNIDKMASEGIKYNNFYVSNPKCSPSRASLLTGKIPKNSGVVKVFFPDRSGMETTQVTIAEVLKKVNYRTACFGKWHLGDIEGQLPTDQGFDEYYGIPYSNDMTIGSQHVFADNVIFNQGYTLAKAKEDQQFVFNDQEAKRLKKKHKKQSRKNFVPIFEGKIIVEYPANQATLTQRYFDRTIDFIKESKDKPFFVYLTPAMPHIPLFASNDFLGKSERGLYGDVIEEIDHHMGQLLSYLKKSGLDKNTMVIYTSDNGPWLKHGDQAGSALPLRDGKFSNYEGGVRVPGVIWYPSEIKGGIVSDDITSTIDILPTLSTMIGIDIKDLNVDGKIIPSLVPTAAKNEAKDVALYSRQYIVSGVRKGDWKLLRKGKGDNDRKKIEGELFNLKEDVSEENNLIESNQKKAKELNELINQYNK